MPIKSYFLRNVKPYFHDVFIYDIRCLALFSLKNKNIYFKVSSAVVIIRSTKVSIESSMALLYDFVVCRRRTF